MLKTLRCVASSLLLIVACANERSLELSTAGEQDAHSEARARRMNVTVTVNGGAATDMSVRELTRDWILDECFDDLSQDPGPPFGTVGCSVPSEMVNADPTGGAGAPASAPDFRPVNTCDQAMCRSLAAICVANRLLELATAAAPVTFKKSAQDSITVPPQDTESNIWFYEDSWHYSSWSATVAAEQLKAPGLPLCDAAGLNTDMGSSTAGTLLDYQNHFASGLADALLHAGEAARSAGEKHKAVSEADSSRTRDSGLASRFAWSDGSMSRGRGSKLLTGGKLNLGLAGFHTAGPSNTLVTNGVCPLEPPKGPTLAAIDVIRLAGPSLTDVTSNPPVSAFIQNSILPRFAERFGDDPSYASSAAFLAAQGLTEEDITNARTYLAHEAQAFARGTDAQLPTRSIPSTRNPDDTLTPHETSIPIYAATATPPPSLPAVHLRTVSRFAGTDVLLKTTPDVAGAVTEIDDGTPAVAGSSVVPSATYARKGLAQLQDYVGSMSRGLLGSTLNATTLDTLGGIVGSVSMNALGRVETCYRYHDTYGPVGDEVRVRIFGYSNVNDIEVLSGISALRCAVEGQIEGAPCTAADMTKWGMVANRTTNAAAGYFGYLTNIEVLVRSTATAPTNKLGPYLYVVRKEPTDPAQPGYYRALGAIRLVQDQSYNVNWRYCSQYPINADADHEVVAMLAPSPECCSQAENSCAGAGLYERLQLESELSTDNDAYESSWRIYLQRAKEAADRADQLGEQLIDAGLEADRRAETAWEKLEALCGGPVSLFDQFLTPRGGPCSTEGMACATPAGSICRDGSCAIDPAATLLANADDPAAQRLAECLGIQSVHRFATLGLDRMCVWVKNGVACEDPSDEVDGPCPFPPDDTGACPTGPAPTDAVIEPVDIHLNVFQDETDEQAASPACSKLRQLRNGGSYSSLAADIAAWRFFTPTDIKKIGERVGWEARPDDYSAITLDGLQVWSTGDGVSPPPSYPPSPPYTWPCTGVYANRENPSLDMATCVYNADGELAPSLFCATTNCGEENDSDRAIMNYRLGRAVFALRILSGAGLGASFVGPYIPDQGEWTGVGPAKTEVWRDDSPGTFYDDAGSRNAIEVGSLTYRSGLLYERPVGGRAVCFDDGSGAPDDIDENVWTTIGSSLAAPSFFSYPASCDQREAIWIPIFTPYPVAQGESIGTATAKIWRGLDGSTGSLDDDVGFEELAFDLLLFPPSDPDAPMVSGSMGDDDPEMDLTNYWDDDYFDFEWVDQNAIAIAKGGIAGRDILDAMELACEVQRLGSAFLGDCPDQPPAEEDSLASLALSENYLRCKAHDVLTNARRTVLANVPQSTIAALNGSLGYEGELGAAAGDVANALVGLREKERHIENALWQIGSLIREVRIKLAINENARDRLQLQVISGFLNALAGCAASIAGIYGAPIPVNEDGVPGDAPLPSTGGKIAGGSTCANTAAQFLFALEDADLQGEDIDLDDSLNWERAKSRLQEQAEIINDNADELDHALREARSALARLETQRLAGLRALAEALMIGTDAAGTQFAVNTVMRRRYNTLQVRYNDAWRYAVKMAWLARRAIEQRLGFRLEDLDQPMTLVDAPSGWANALCTSTGIDYAKIRDESQLESDNYADAYIGDYVRNLERVMQSYEHDFPFADAADTAVISLRDDITSTRADCEISVNNLLAYSGLLDTAYDPTTGTNLVYDTAVPPNLISGTPPTPVWESAGCALVPPVTGVITNCIAITRLAGNVAADVPIPEFVREMGEVPGYRITFAPGVLPPPPDPPPTSFTSASALVQRVNLEAGFYRLSWYGRQLDPPPPPTSHDPAAAVVLRTAEGTQITTDRTLTFTSTGVGWNRYHFIIRVSGGEAEYHVAIVPQSGTSTEHSVDIAGVMLENVSAAIYGQPDPDLPAELLPEDYLPSPYASTSAAGIGRSTVCEDSDGRVFRDTRWTRGCVRLCPTGFGTCPDGEMHCYREVLFGLTLNGIERGGLLQESGFAYGNYNYRLDGVAVNLVGTGLRDCSDSPTPDICYSSGSIPYSIAHLGPYKVRNHAGDVYEAPLFTGRIEHGRALAAERYLSNPISSADRALIQDYWHHELRGRPITGNYGLRIWDADGIVFDNLEDVQIILDYRYWTRFE